MSPYELCAAPEVLARLHPRLRTYFGPIPPGHVGLGEGVFAVVGTPRRWLHPFLALFARDDVMFPVWARDVPFTVENRPVRVGRGSVTRPAASTTGTGLEARTTPAPLPTTGTGLEARTTSAPPPTSASRPAPSPPTEVAPPPPTGPTPSPQAERGTPLRAERGTPPAAEPGATPLGASAAPGGRGAVAVRARRTFRFPTGDRTMVDAITAEPLPGGGHVLVDHLGRRGRVSAELDVAVDADGRDAGALRLVSTRVSFRVLGREWSLPAGIAPQVRLEERFDDGVGRQRVSLVLTAPIVGTLYRYEGSFTYRVVPDDGTTRAEPEGTGTR